MQRFGSKIHPAEKEEVEHHVKATFQGIADKLQK